MRDIKFRAWIESVGGSYMAVQGTPDLETIGAFFFHYDPDDDLVRALMQYTGLKDKNGIEIYEGDIVRSGSVKHGSVFVVEWKVVEGSQGSNDDEYQTAIGFDVTPDGQSTYEVIGNIHENPELLGKT